MKRIKPTQIRFRLHCFFPPPNRFVNSFYTFAIIAVIFQYRRAIRGIAQSRNDALLESAVLATFPLLFFYNMLFYTDLGSTCFVLLSCSLTMQGHRAWGALAGLIAVTFRQTNIVWVGWAAAVRLLDDLQALGVPLAAWSISPGTGFRIANMALVQIRRQRLWLFYLPHACEILWGSGGGRWEMEDGWVSEDLICTMTHSSVCGSVGGGVWRLCSLQ